MANLNNNVKEPRAMLKSKAAFGSVAFEQMFGPNTPGNILYPLHRTRGVLMPYTPNIVWAASVDYEEYHATHSNYKYNAFAKSAPGPFQVDFILTAQTDAEARYMLAVMHFLKSVTKMNFGEKAGNLAGTPPPIMVFSYLGKYMFNDVPVIIKSYQYSLENGVDYVPVRFPNNPDNDTFVPIQVSIAIELEIQMNTRTIRKEFDLESFTSGDYINNDSNFKGWI